MSMQRGSTPTPVIPGTWTGATTWTPTSSAAPFPVYTAAAPVAVTAGSVTCSNVATGASAIVAAASTTRRKLLLHNSGSVTVYLNNGAAADNTKFPLPAGSGIEFTSEEGTAQLEWRAYSASAGVLGIIVVEG